MLPRGAPARGDDPREGSTVRGSLPSVLRVAHVNAIPLKRPNFGTAARRIQVQVNSFAITAIPDGRIFQYDVIEPGGHHRAQFMRELLEILQAAETEDFPKISYDGRKIAFASRELPLGDSGSRKFPVTLPQANGGRNPTRNPRIYYITLRKVAEINADLLKCYITGQRSTEKQALMAITALNVVLRMEPKVQARLSRRSFYTPLETQNIGGGLTLCRGIFHSIRPTIWQLVLNVDIVTEGTSPAFLSPVHNFSQNDQNRLAHFLRGLPVLISTTGTKTWRIRGLSNVGADAYEVLTRAGNTTTVAQYFRSLGQPLRFPTVICARVGSTAMVPLEMCIVPRGQLMHRRVPDDKLKDVLEFSTLRPEARLERIKRGIQNLQNGQSDYVRQFGMAIDTEPVKIDARVLNPPKLKYSSQSRQPTFDPQHGAWNMIDKKFFDPASISRWVMVVYESPNRLPEAACREVANGFLAACASVGVHVDVPEPLIRYQHPHGSVEGHLKAVGAECNARLGAFPSLLVVVLPDGGNDIYTAVKHFGDVTVGIPTQCLNANKCWRAKPQYWANVLLKVNPKLGGINVVPDASVTVLRNLSDPVNPTIIMGADVGYLGNGVISPSFSAVVGSVDSHSVKYVTTSRAQTGRQDIINDLKDMCKDILKLYRGYRQNIEKQKQVNPKRLIFYRGGVSEGHFKHVLELELPMIKGKGFSFSIKTYSTALPTPNAEACKEMNMDPQITLVTVRKRHHNRLFPLGNIADRSGNSPAGSVIDSGIVHPTNFDFILQSHPGLLGSSRPAHYTVLYDDYHFNADSIQTLSFALCHIYARSTRSVSIPAPLYYADIVCSRAKNHFDPQVYLQLTNRDPYEYAYGDNTAVYEAYKLGYKPLHKNQRTKMYFT